MNAKRDENKLKRKKSKYYRIVKEEYGVEPSDEPSQYVMVCNVGHSMGINRQELLARFGEHWKVRDVILFARKSHAFVVFDSESEASRCLGTVNELVHFSGVTGPIHLIYLKTRPDCVDEVDDENSTWGLPPGAVIIENFVSEEEEGTLVSKIVQESTYETHLKQRRAVHYGYEFVYGKNNVDVDCPLPTPLPPECDFIRERLSFRGYELDWSPDQLTVNEYHPGHGIPPHVDTHSAFEDPILSLSLNSDTVMEFSSEDRVLNVVLPRRSILIMAEESRYRWIHGIPARKTDVVPSEGGYVVKQRGLRVSYTFRKVLRPPHCDCQWPELCDWRKTSESKESPGFFEDKYVHSVYDQIFDHFSTTRHKPWPKVLEFVQSLTPASLLIDVGCGNGKYFGFSKCFEVGCDYNAGLVEITNGRGFEALRTNCLHLPFKDNTADAVISIAVLHHLSTHDRRRRAVEEILRVLRPSPVGRALVYVWAKEQNETSVSYLKTGRDTTAVDSSGTDLSQRDLLVPWKKKDESSHLRYYHVFESGELEKLCLEAGARVLNSYYDRGNWCIVFCK